MDQFIYWGVFAAFGIIVVLYWLWMVVTERGDRAGPGDGSPAAAETGGLHLISRSQPDGGAGGRGDPGPPPDGGGSGASPGGDESTRTFWKGK